MSVTTDAQGWDESSAEPSEQKTEAKTHWYAVQVASGCEKRVKANLEQRVHTLDVADRILQVRIPSVSTMKVRKDGTRTTIEEKVFPGYVLVNVACVWDANNNKWEVDDEAWQAIKSTPHVINFVGAEQKRTTGRGRGHVKPLPLSRAEVERVFKQTQEQEPVVKIDMAIGDKVLVLSGPFKDFEGEVIEVSPERSKLKALLSIFGRDTPVELEFTQVEKQS